MGSSCLLVSLSEPGTYIKAAVLGGLPFLRPHGRATCVKEAGAPEREGFRRIRPHQDDLGLTHEADPRRCALRDWGAGARFGPVDKSLHVKD